MGHIRGRDGYDRLAGVAKNAWWLATCPKHGEQAHYAVLGGMCGQCKKDLENKPDGLRSKDPR